MIEFIKTCDQYPRTFNFGNFFNSIIFSLTLYAQEKIPSENTVWEKWAI